MSNLKIFAKTIENKALEQVNTLISQDAFKDCKVRIMPDVHAGAGCVIGFTADLGDKVIPNIVGVDIGCGMMTVPLGMIDIDYAKLDRVIRERIPAGMNVHDTPNDDVNDLFINHIRCRDKLRNKDGWLDCSLGTLGGGNHFIEIDEDCEGSKYLIIHTGSRNLGKQVADIYQDIAVKNLTTLDKTEIYKVITELKADGREMDISNAVANLKAKKKNAPPKELCYLEGTDRDDYLHDMKLCQKFAQINRATIVDNIVEGMGWNIDTSKIFETIHNYIDDDNMVRKGAISAKEGQQLLIPINMRDGCILGIGKGNQEWNCSAPHGAGRIMSRSQAKKDISIEDYQNAMRDIYTTSVGYDTIDEAPFAYRGMDEILECINDTVEVQKILHPVYNFKAGETIGGNNHE